MTEMDRSYLDELVRKNSEIDTVESISIFTESNIISYVAQLEGGEQHSCSSDRDSENEKDGDKKMRHQQPALGLTFAKDQTQVLQKWFLDHLDHPYIKKVDKAILASKTGLTPKQITGWFTNNRKRKFQKVKEIAKKKGKDTAYIRDIMKMKFDKDLDQNLSERSRSEESLKQKIKKKDPNYKNNKIQKSKNLTIPDSIQQINKCGETPQVLKEDKNETTNEIQKQMTISFGKESAISIQDQQIMPIKNTILAFKQKFSQNNDSVQGSILKRQKIQESSSAQKSIKIPQLPLLSAYTKNNIGRINDSLFNQVNPTSRAKITIPQLSKQLSQNTSSLIINEHHDQMDTQKVQDSQNTQGHQLLKLAQQYQFGQINSHFQSTNQQQVNIQKQIIKVPDSRQQVNNLLMQQKITTPREIPRNTNTNLNLLKTVQGMLQNIQTQPTSSQEPHKNIQLSSQMQSNITQQQSLLLQDQSIISNQQIQALNTPKIWTPTAIEKPINFINGNQMQIDTSQKQSMQAPFNLNASIQAPEIKYKQQLARFPSQKSQEDIQRDIIKQMTSLIKAQEQVRSLKQQTGKNQNEHQNTIESANSQNVDLNKINQAKCPDGGINENIQKFQQSQEGSKQNPSDDFSKFINSINSKSTAEKIQENLKEIQFIPIIFTMCPDSKADYKGGLRNDSIAPIRTQEGIIEPLIDIEQQIQAVISHYNKKYTDKAKQMKTAKNNDINKFFKENSGQNKGMNTPNRLLYSSFNNNLSSNQNESGNTKDKNDTSNSGENKKDQWKIQEDIIDNIEEYVKAQLEKFLQKNLDSMPQTKDNTRQTTQQLNQHSKQTLKETPVMIQNLPNQINSKMIDASANNNLMDQYKKEKKSKSSFFCMKQSKTHIDTRRSSSAKLNENSQKLDKYNKKDLNMQKSKNNMSSQQDHFKLLLNNLTDKNFYNIQNSKESAPVQNLDNVGEMIKNALIDDQSADVFKLLTLWQKINDQQQGQNLKNAEKKQSSQAIVDIENRQMKILSKLQQLSNNPDLKFLLNPNARDQLFDVVDSQEQDDYSKNQSGKPYNSHGTKRDEHNSLLKIESKNNSLSDAIEKHCPKSINLGHPSSDSMNGNSNSNINYGHSASGKQVSNSKKSVSSSSIKQAQCQKLNTLYNCKYEKISKSSQGKHSAQSSIHHNVVEGSQRGLLGSSGDNQCAMVMHSVTMSVSNDGQLKIGNNQVKQQRDTVNYVEEKRGHLQDLYKVVQNIVFQYQNENDYNYQHQNYHHMQSNQNQHNFMRNQQQQHESNQQMQNMINQNQMNNYPGGMNAFETAGGMSNLMEALKQQQVMGQSLPNNSQIMPNQQCQKPVYDPIVFQKLVTQNAIQHMNLMQQVQNMVPNQEAQKGSQQQNMQQYIQNYSQIITDQINESQIQNQQIKQSINNVIQNKH